MPRRTCVEKANDKPHDLDAEDYLLQALSAWDEQYGSCKQKQSFEVVALRALLENAKQTVTRKAEN